MIGSLGNLMFKLELRSQASICYEHQISSGNLSRTIVPSTKELYSLNSGHSVVAN